MTSLLRNRVDELMDDPAIDQIQHRRALQGLARINRLSFTARSFLPAVLALARTQRRNELSLLDVACGGGDVPVQLAMQARGHGVTIHLRLVDRSPTALSAAEALARRSGISCQCFPLEFPRDTLAPADIVTNSLFLHHLDRDGCVEALRQMAQAAEHLVLVNDLRRSFVGLAVAWTGVRLLSRSHVVHYDGPASVRAAWTLGELRRFAIDAGMADANIRRCWPWRMLLTWWRPHAS